MSLVAYSSSEDEEEELASTPPAKKRKVSANEEDEERVSDLPPLPASFLDQYSSTVRTSTQDDPSLHGGRKRVTPHVQGNWPTHVYLEWHPSREEAGTLSELVAAAQKTIIAHSDDTTTTTTTTKKNNTTNPNHNNNNAAHTPITPDRNKLHSLLQNHLGVPLPLHISLSRPVVLKTDRKDPFFNQLKQHLVHNNSGIRNFTVQPKGLAWHPNETSTRWFLVLRLESAAAEDDDDGVTGKRGMEELRRLLGRCNDVARRFGQGMLYATYTNTKPPGEEPGSGGFEKKDISIMGDENENEHFHISIAWSLQQSPGSMEGNNFPDKGGALFSERKKAGLFDGAGTGIPYELLVRLTEVEIPFTEVKVRIGQDVHRIPLKMRRVSCGAGSGVEFAKKG